MIFFGAHARLWIVVLAFFLVFPVLLKFVLRFVLAPIRMHKKHRLAARVNWEPTTPAQLTPEARDFIGRVVPAFRELGFEVVANLSQAGAVPNTVATKLLFVNRESGDFATAHSANAKHSRSLVLAIHSHFVDGFRISTGSGAGASYLPKDKAVASQNFSWIDDPVMLYDAHRRRLNCAGRATSPRLTPAAGEELSHFDREWERGIRRQIRCGYLRPEPHGGAYRFTWKGAFMATWKVQDPFKRWRRLRGERKARREWEALGMDPAGLPGTGHLARRAEEVPEPQPAVTPVSAGHELAYQAALSPGEVRSLSAADGSVTVRVGNRSFSQTLAWQWARLLAIAMFTLLVIFNIGSYLFLYQLGISPRALRLRWWALIPLLLLAWELSRLVRVLRRVRAITVVHASADGLRFQDAPGFPAGGFVARPELESLVIVRQASVGFRLLYRLEARRYRGVARQVLLLARDKKSASDARDGLLNGLGISLSSDKL